MLRSTFFANKFAKGKDVFFEENISADAMTAFLQFLYTQDQSLLKEHCEETVVWGIEYDIPDLMRATPGKEVDVIQMWEDLESYPFLFAL